MNKPHELDNTCWFCPIEPKTQEKFLKSSVGIPPQVNVCGACRKAITLHGYRDLQNCLISGISFNKDKDDATSQG